MQLGIAEGSSVTWVAAALTPDGLRTHKIQNKLKTGKEVKVRSTALCERFSASAHRLVATHSSPGMQEFLREKGIGLNRACSVIRQAEVTALADSNCEHPSHARLFETHLGTYTIADCVVQ